MTNLSTRQSMNPTFHYSTIPLFLLFLLLAPSTMLHAQCLEIHQLDVGQGDAALIIICPNSDSRFAPCASRYAILIDSGPKGKGDKVIVPYLHKLSIDTLNAILLTHYHADHIGGVSEVLKSEVVLKFYDHGGSYDSKVFHDYVSGAGNRRSTLNAGDTILNCRTRTSTILLSCFSSAGHILNGGYDGNDDENTNSIASLLTYVTGSDTFKFFTAGDLQGNQESLIARNNPSTYCVNVLKISHHGSRTSSSADALEAFSPEAVFISCGNGNSNGHPYPETLVKLDNQRNVRFIYQTERGDHLGQKSVVAGNIILKVFSGGYHTIQTDYSTDTLYYSHRGTGSRPLSPPTIPDCIGGNPTKMLEGSGIYPATGGTPERSHLVPSAMPYAHVSASYHDKSIWITAVPATYVQRVSIFNILGAALRTFSPRNLVGSLSIKDRFSSGVYFVSVKTPDRIFVNKILIVQ